MSAVAPSRRVSPLFQAIDTSTTKLSPTRFIRGAQPRDVETVAARLGDQFLALNRPALAALGCDGNLRHTGRSVAINLTTSSAIGAVPLTSPLTGRPDLGLIVRPRFAWDGLGKILAQSGMQTLPHLLPLAALPYSDREIPPWVLSSVVLDRLTELIKSLSRRFDSVEEELEAPRGAVDWARWARNNVTRGKPNAVPCRYPELQADSELLGFVHYVLTLQRASLEGQRSAGEIVRALLAQCEMLLHEVERWPAKAVAPSSVAGWLRRPMTSLAVREGLTAGLWTVEERGLAGTSELSGLPWRLDMAEVFENWVASQLARWAPRNGFACRTGQRRETVSPIHWDPPYLGSQRALIPDVILTRDDLTIVVDAKYKAHWDELEEEGWSGVDQELRDAHRNDLLQVLAYTTVQRTEQVIGVLLYPCRPSTWERLRARGQLVNRAAVASGPRRVDLLLAALPFTAQQGEADGLFDEFLKEH